MMNWLYYLLESNLYLAFFYGFYRLFLHRETFYQLNRCYLLSTPVLAFLLPVFQIGYLNGLFNPVQNQSSVVVQFSGEMMPAATFAPVLTAGDTIFVCYLVVAGFFFFRLVTSLYRILQMTIRGDKTRKGGIVQVHFGQLDSAFSFFNFLFINPATDKQNIVLQHEMIHIRQKHSFDIVFFEVLLICNWFNPLCWLMKQDIKLVHEYIADEATTNQGLPKHDYAMFLIRNSFGSFQNPLTSQMFNQSILKNRIKMLNKKRTAGRARLRLLYVLPLTAGMLCASTLGFTKEYAMVDLYAKKDAAVAPIMLQESKQQAKKEKKKSFSIESSFNKETGNNRPVKLIVINSKLSQAENVRAVEDYDELVQLNGTEGRAKYGKRAANGALEFAGKNTRLSITFPPPIVVKNPPSPPEPPLQSGSKSAKIKFPPTPPKAKKVNIKFPPPIVKPDVPVPAAPSREDNQVKFPPPVVTPMMKYEGQPGVTSALGKNIKLGPNPLYVNNKSVVAVNPEAGKIVKFKARSVRFYEKSSDAAIQKYGEAARDGVIELEDGVFFYAEPEAVKKE
ncbi:MAG TPA: M56 family metallopeptidase [Pedobacter sp.]|nr:M56 family metallopeptidase [Pedobacter sp.]